MQKRSQQRPLLSEELHSANFGDERLTKRLGVIVDNVAQAPERSFPESAGGDAALEATYRFLNNERVTAERILAPHLAATGARMANEDATVLAIHDTTEFKFKGESIRDGLGRLRTGGQGFFGHFALAATIRGEPLGVIGLQTITRTEPPQKKRRRSHPEKESKKWRNLAEEVCARVDRRSALVHVMDREADSYELLSLFVTTNRRFVVRSQHDRCLAETNENGHPKLVDALKTVEGICEREVSLSRRAKAPTPVARKVHPPRNARWATLTFSATRLTLRRSGGAPKGLPMELEVNVVRVYETNPPEDQPSIEWRLLTTESIETTSDVLKIVDIYRKRWLIEEYFKALKTGCAYEDRQLETKDALLNALAIFVPIAWTLLALRTLAQSEPDTLAASVLPEYQLDVLKAVSKHKLSEQPTVRETMLAIAALGGHIKNNGDPGWQVLGRGYQRLLEFQIGWLAAQPGRCDQS